MISPIYRAQVDLLLRILPQVAKEKVFALKGGTAINLFVRDMPRLSVDIDLAYQPFDDRKTALTTISEALSRIKERLQRTMPGISVTSTPQIDGQEVKLNCQLHRAQVKIEVNATTRGHIYPVRLMQVSDTVQESFGKFAAINVVSHAELFGGKICAALDRQHPRDLFDIHHLLKNEGFTEEVKMGFLVFLLSHARPIHEVIMPNFLDQRSAFDTQFAGMTTTLFTYDDYERTREHLVREIHRQLTDADRAFLISFKKGMPDWGLFPLEVLKDLPAIQWKLSNIHKLIRQNPDKHTKQLKALQDKLFQ